MYFLVINYVIISRKPAALSRDKGIKDMIARVCLNEYNEYFASISTVDHNIHTHISH